MSELVRLLNDLGRDASLAEAYAKDPDPILASYGLRDDEIEAMKSGDLTVSARFQDWMKFI